MSEKPINAEYHFKAGNFLSAKSAYEQMLNEESDLRSRNHFEHKISDCSKLYNEFISSSGVGEAQFPLIHQEKWIASIVTIKVSSTPSGRKTIPKTENIFKAVSSYLNSLIEKSSNRFCILDWRLHELELSIKPVSINHSTPSDIIGNSFELAAAIALLSNLIGMKIDPSYVFTGSLHEESGSVRLGPVVDYEAKLKFAKTERPGLKSFFVPMGSVIGSESEVVECENFGDVVEKVFPDFKECLVSKLDEWKVGPSEKEPSERRHPKFVRWKREDGIVTYSRDRSLCDMEIAIFVVDHPKLVYSELKQVFGFFKNNLGLEIKESKAAVVLDGVKSNFLTALLMSSDHLKNPPNIKFISVLKPYDETVAAPEDKEKVSKDTEAVIVRFDNHKEKEGEVFYFRRKLNS